MPIFTTKTGQGINLDPINVPANTTVRIIAAPYDVDLATLPMLPVSGGTANYLTKFTGASTLGNSLLRDDGTSIGLGVAPSAGALLDVYGTVRSTALTMKGLYPILTIDYAMAMAGTAIQIMTNGLMRWQATISGSEAGSNGGSNYNLNRYADDGTTVLGSLLAATRASGLVKVNGTILQLDTFGVGIKTVPSATDALDVNGSVLLRSAVTGYGLWSLTSTDPRLRFNETDGGTNAKVHDFVSQAGIFYGRTYDDAISGSYNWLQVARTSGSVNVATITLASATAVNLTSPLVAVTNGNLSVARTGATVVASINKENGQSGVLSFQQGGLARWQLWENNTAETGSDVGSNLVLARYSDAGVSLGSSLEITRSTGELGLGTTVNVGWRVNVASGVTGSLYANGPIGLATVTGAIQFWGELTELFDPDAGDRRGHGRRSADVGLQHVFQNDRGGPEFCFHGGSRGRRRHPDCADRNLHDGEIGGCDRCGDHAGERHLPGHGCGRQFGGENRHGNYRGWFGELRGAVHAQWFHPGQFTAAG